MNIQSPMQVFNVIPPSSNVVRLAGVLEDTLLVVQVDRHDVR
jgi:hypothetical protein